MTKSLSASRFFIDVVIGGGVIYPSDSDPNNIKYTLCKNGLYEMNLDPATGTMIAKTGDTLDLQYVIKVCQVKTSDLFARGRMDRTVYPP
jgi:hypothetical protein